MLSLRTSPTISEPVCNSVRGRSFKLLAQDGGNSLKESDYGQPDMNLPTLGLLLVALLCQSVTPRKYGLWSGPCWPGGKRIVKKIVLSHHKKCSSLKLIFIAVLLRFPAFILLLVWCLSCLLKILFKTAIYSIVFTIKRMLYSVSGSNAPKPMSATTIWMGVFETWVPIWRLEHVHQRIE